MRQSELSMILLATLCSTLLCIPTVRIVKADDAFSVHIRADGNVDPPTAPIQRNGDIYTLTGNIASNRSGIVIERDSIKLNGAGFALQRSGNGTEIQTGVDLSYRINVTVENIVISGFYYGVVLNYSMSNSVSGNNITKNGYGISVGSSWNNNISGNSITNNGLFADPYSVGSGIYLCLYSASNTISGNNIAANRGVGIRFWNSFVNNIFGNNITNSNSGIFLYTSNYNSISWNHITDNGYGVSLDHSCKNNVYRNNITANTDHGILLDFSANNNVFENNIANNKGSDPPANGISLWYASNSNSISGNNITANQNSGIDLYSSSDNDISGNNIANNKFAIYLGSSSSNRFYHNNIMNNTNNQVLSYSSTNAWDDGARGNYWSDYLSRYPNASEIDSTGIGDTAYVIDANNTDRYPPMNSYVIPEFPSLLAPSLFMVSTLLAVIVYRRKHLAFARA